MDILWPSFLILLAIVPVTIAAYVWALRRRRRFAVRYSSLALVRAALPQTAAWRRHAPFGLFLAALSSLVLAITRPVATVEVPVNQSIVILAIDISRSMCATDIAPNRLVAAQEAALSFVRRQPAGAHIGLVVFAGFAETVQPPTTDQAALETAIRGLNTARRTAIGSGILESIDAIAEADPSVAPSLRVFSDGPAPTPVPEGFYVPDIIVLLTDGASNSGPSPLLAAQQAADRGVRVYTIGFGTASEIVSMPFCGAQYQSESGFGGGGFGGGSGFGSGGGFMRGIDEVTLQNVAALTGAEYYAATSSGELVEVFENLPTYFVTREETTEISVAFAALGALLAALAIGLALLWQPLS
ncbi:MAG: VWA domain-containing protein [Anaerolineales bacterium]|nr:VWA domain-containing protein [Anaerolineales bacterium]